MNSMQPTPINQQALCALKTVKNRLTRQQFRTFRGQILAGDTEGAMKGLVRMLGKQNPAQ